MSLIEFFKKNGSSGYGYGSTARDVTRNLNLSGCTYLLTGSNSGLGLETLKILTMRGARIIACFRTLEKAKFVCETLPQKNRVIPIAFDLSEPDSIRDAITKVAKLGYQLDGIIANAAIMALPNLQQKFGYELQFFTNHVGHFILVNGLLSQLKADGRVVILSSVSHKMSYRDGIQFENLSGEKEYSPWSAYGQSKLCNMLFAKHLATRMPKSNQTSNSVHPGMIPTNLTRYLPAIRVAIFHLASPLILKSVSQGSATQCYVVTNPKLRNITGSYFVDCNVAIPSHYGQDAEMALELWKRTEKIVNSV
jgi:NAD(P)-dependent dehydrogenase (short-subunit alcohol dehydrogenase family)